MSSAAPVPPPAVRAPRRREVFGYCMFDFANSSYTTLISTVAYPVYFRQAVVGAAEGRADFFWSVAQATAMVLLILTSPIMGALADYSGRKKAFLLGTTIQTVTACALLYAVRPGEVFLAAALYVLGTVGFEGGYVFYNAFLPEVSTPRTVGRISGLSWGVGFIGGLAALAACIPLLARPLMDAAGRLDPAAVVRYRLSFVVVAAFFALFAVPTFLFLRESRKTVVPMGPLAYVGAGFARVAQTLSHLRRHRQAAKYVAAAFFFYGGIQTVIKFSAIYATVTFGIQGLELLLLFMVSNVVAVPGTVLAGRLADRVGGKRALIATLVAWFALLIAGALATSKPAFWVMALGVAVGMGSTQAIGRSLMVQLSPPERESEFFGFYVLAGQLGSIFSLLSFGAVSSFGGGQRFAVLLTAPLFLVATLLTATIRERTA